MKYAESSPIVLESHYPYTATTGTCDKTEASGGPVKVIAIHNVRAGSSAALMAAIEKGPVSVTVEADTYAFQGYKSGIMNDPGCGTQLDHAITAVGYGTLNGVAYYIVRNSWGSSWGDRGHINIAATTSGLGICGIQQVSVYPETN
jgi:KDEL-tailed cysteine endopeptidase